MMRIRYELRCDACHETLAEFDIGFLRVAAFKRGWVHRNGVADFCKSCARDTEWVTLTTE